MLDCLIIGDSIAVGTQQFRPECVAYATGGINTKQWNTKYNKTMTARTVIISLGSNDHAGINSFQELMKVRQKVDAEHVFWILPAIKPEVRDIVQLIAVNYGDTVLPINRLQADKIHPSWSGYKDLANQTK
jgi:lysophospholipase L1-like esterase